jgi:hypothetical protein
MQFQVRANPTYIADVSDAKGIPMACSKRDFGSTQKGVAIPQPPFRYCSLIKEVNRGRSPCTHFVSVPKAVCPAHLLSSAVPPCLARSQSLQLTGSEKVTYTRPLSRQRALQKPRIACRSVSRGFFRPSDSRMYDCSSKATAHPTRQGRLLQPVWARASAPE